MCKFGLWQRTGLLYPFCQSAPSCGVSKWVELPSKVMAFQSRRICKASAIILGGISVGMHQ